MYSFIYFSLFLGGVICGGVGIFGDFWGGASLRFFNFTGIIIP